MVTRRSSVTPHCQLRCSECGSGVSAIIVQTGHHQYYATVVHSSYSYVMLQIVERVPGNLALRKRDDNGQHMDWTYEQYYEQVRTVARAFISLGLSPLHTVSVLGHSDPCHHISNLATIHAGAFTGGMYLTNTAQACEYIAQDSRANIIVVGDQVQLDKILSIRHNLPDLRSIVLFDGETSVPGVITWQQLLKIGQDNSDSALNERLRNIAINQCCVVSYTSGTTGNPKGVMLSHDNITYTAKQSLAFFKLNFGEGNCISYLPQSHMAGMMLDQFICMANGSLCCFADKQAIQKGICNQHLYKSAHVKL